ncbi:MAG: DUF29 domain-containing protein [Crocosphaera sp.]|nr:DUF29 domain-containing protein [Crocosphaera sp.]
MINTRTKIQLKQLYETDDHLWLEGTIRLLKENCLEELDVENLIEELDSLGRRDKNRVESFLRQIIIHLLLLQYWTNEYNYNYRHWRGEIATFRVQINKYLTTNLKNYLTEALEAIYQDAVFIVTEKTGLNKSVFPENCCYSLEEILDKTWLPN